VADSEPPEETPAPEPEDKPKTVPLGWLGTNNPMPPSYRTHVIEKRVEVLMPQPPQIITVKEPSLSTNLAIVVRDWLKSGVRSFEGNLQADTAFCSDAFKATFAESRWGKMIVAVTHIHKLLNWLLGLGVPAAIIGSYIKFVYPIAGVTGTVIVVLSLLVFASLVTVRVTRKLYDKTVDLSLEAQGELPVLRSRVETLEHDLGQTAQRLEVLQKRFEPSLTMTFEPEKEACKQFFPRREVTQYRVCITSPVALKDAELVANKVTIGSLTHDGLHLRPRHDRQEQGTKRVALKPFKTEAWDVVSDHSPHGVALTCIKALGLMPFDDGLHEFELMATGGDSFPATKIVNMEVRDGRLVRFDVNDGRLSDLPV
jgi:hypothetical protein